MFTDEPAVLTWMVALSPRTRPDPTGHHWWREFVVEAHREATDAWLALREATALGYAAEEADFAEQHPAPRLKDFMVHLASGRWAPEEVLR